MPPIELLDLKELDRGEYNTKRPRNIYLLYEGQNTEPFLINPLLSSKSVIRNNGVRFRPVEKRGNSIGVTQPHKLVDAANKAIITLKAKGQFKEDYDKILVVFDLDVLENNQRRINTLISNKNKDVILCCTNPAIELFLLLSLDNAVENVISKYEKEIIANNKVNPETLEISTSGIRFVNALVRKYLKINSKSFNQDFSFIIDKMDEILKEEQKINQKLKKAANNLTSNIAYVLNKISNDDYDIEY